LSAKRTREEKNSFGRSTHTLLSTSHVMSTEYAIAGAAGGIAIVITTTVAQKFRSVTAEGRAQALNDLYHEVNERHQTFVNGLLKMLDDKCKEDEAFKNIKNTTNMLKLVESWKNNIMAKVRRSGLYRLSPMFKKAEIDEAIKQLLRVDNETITSSTKAQNLLEPNIKFEDPQSEEESEKDTKPSITETNAVRTYDGDPTAFSNPSEGEDIFTHADDRSASQGGVSA